MLEYIRQFLNGIQRTWQRLSLSARVNIALSLAATIAVIAVLVVYGSRPQYVGLYSGLDREDSSAIIQYLEDNDIPYQARDAGATIMVPTRKLSEVRVALRRCGQQQDRLRSGYHCRAPQDDQRSGNAGGYCHQR